MKHLVNLAVCLFISATVVAQTTKEEMLANRNKMCSNHLAYQTDFKAQTKAPKGYTPFYISHYGRHGSRYHYSGEDYKRFYTMISKADSANAFTEYGKTFRDRFYRLYEDAYLRAGDLTQTGAKQHKGISDRMFKSFPEVFQNDAKIDVKASTSQRCIVSMDAFCQQLMANNPKLQIKVESSKRLMSYICNEDPRTIGIGFRDMPMFKKEWREAFNALNNKLIKPDRMINAIFADTAYVSKNIDKHQFMRKFHELYGCMQGIDDLADVNFDDVWTEEELWANWQVQNAYWYGQWGTSPLTNAVGTKYAKNLLRNIIEEADKAIAGNGISATLRFGHDTALLPLTGLMQLEGCNAQVTNLEELYKYWCDYKIIPMAGNLQLIFYRSAKSNDILVKAMLNENEVKLPIESETAPYYKWSEVEAFYNKIINE